MVPVAAIFKPMDDLTNAYNNFRVYGTCILIILFLCVFVGVRFVSKFAPVALFAVLISILCVYIGIFLTGPTRGPQYVFVCVTSLLLLKCFSPTVNSGLNLS
jgi:potassium/chloride transporter 4/5/6